MANCTVIPNTFDYLENSTIVGRDFQDNYSVHPLLCQLLQNNPFTRLEQVSAEVLSFGRDLCRDP